MGMREFSRLLTIAETFVPLREEERAWIEESTIPGDRVVPISIGFCKGDAIVVTGGPLRERKAMVKRFIRKKCLAILAVYIGEVRVTTEVRLALLPEREATR